MPNNPALATNAKRERSTIEFPYVDLEDSIEIVRGVHAVGGTGCQREQLAAHMHQSPTGGGFSLRVGTAKLYGLLTYDHGAITLTELGIRICDGQQEKQARAEAFLTIPLYKALYEKYKSATLPPTSGLEGQMVSLGVAPKQKGKARQVFLRAAKQAGFFDFGSDRLVAPSIRRTEKPSEPGKPPKPPGDHSGATETGYFHPFIAGLIKTLPGPETEWTMEARTKWLQAAANIFDLIYTDQGADKKSIKVELS